MNESVICPVCKEHEATTHNNVDVHSDTMIACCEGCHDLLSEATRYQWYHNAPRKWVKANRQKLDNARDELMAEYKRERERGLW